MDENKEIEINSETDALAFVRQDGRALADIPTEYCTEAVCREALQAHPGALSAEELTKVGRKILRPFDTKNYDAAVFVLGEAVKIDPESADAWQALGNALRQKGDYNAAIETYRKALAKAAGGTLQDFNIRFALGDAFYKKGDYDAAIEAFRKALAIYPKNDRALGMLGDALRQKGDYDAAIETYRKALRVDPENSYQYRDLAYAHLGKKDYANAVSAISKALEQEMSIGDFWCTLAEIYEAAGDYAKAAENVRRALERNLHPDKEAARQLLARCEAKLK